jgi:hypothetical protein
MNVKIVHCPTSQKNRAKVTALVTLIEQRLGIKAVTILGTTGQFEVIVNGKRIAERGGNWLTQTFGGGYPDLERVVEQLEKRRDAERMQRMLTISFINSATIEVEGPDGWIHSLTLPEGSSIPEEFNLGSEIEIIMIYPAIPPNQPTYWKIRHVASKRVTKAIVSGVRHRDPRISDASRRTPAEWGRLVSAWLRANR